MYICETFRSDTKWCTLIKLTFECEISVSTRHIRDTTIPQMTSYNNNFLQWLNGTSPNNCLIDTWPSFSRIFFFVSMDRVYVRTCVYAKQFQNFGRFVDNFSGQILLKLQKNLPLAKLLIYPLSLCRFLVCCYTVNFCIFSNF